MVIIITFIFNLTGPNYNHLDRFGRKNTILLGTTAFVIGTLFEIISVNFAMLMVGRLFVGFGEGFLTNSIPLYHTEIAPPDVRGRLICFFSATLSVGTIVGFFVNFGTSYLTTDWSWRAPFLIHLFVSLCLYFAALLPYSPRWLIDKDRKEEALAVLAQLHESTIDDPDVRHEFDYIVEELETERSFGTRTFAECFRGTNLKRTLWAVFTADGCACTGIYCINFYLPQIIQQTGVGNNSLSIATSGSSNILVLIITILTILFIDKFGRRPVFVSGAFFTGLSMYIIGAVFQACHVVDSEGNVDLINDHARGAVIGFIFVFQAFYAYSWGPVAYVYPAEVSNTRMRSKTLAIVYGLNWVVGIFMTFVMPIFMEKTIYGPYYFFGGCCTLLFIGSLFMPETSGKTLEEIDRLFNPLPQKNEEAL